MPRFLPYNPDQALLLPPSVKDVLGEDHVCFFVRRVVQRLDLSGFRAEYGAEGGASYDPALLLSVWLYAYLLGITSSRRLEQRIREDLGFRYLAGAAEPDHWTLSYFRRRHPRALNDVFTQVLELARELKLARLGKVAVDSTRVAAQASRQRMDSQKRLRAERLYLRRQIRAWQKQANAEDRQEGAGVRLGRERIEQLERRLAEIPGRLERLRKSGQKQLSRTDPDSRFLRDRGRRWVLGYSAEAAVTEDHFIVAQRVTQNSSDSESLVPLVEQVEQRCGRKPRVVLADTGFFSAENLREMKRRGVDAYIPDPALTYEFRGGGPARGMGNRPVRNPDVLQMRAKMRTPAGRAAYQQRKQMPEPVFGALKEQRGMRRFRLRGLLQVGIEFALACLAHNLVRLYHQAPELK